jgi:hypothetical protein
MQPARGFIEIVEGMRSSLDDRSAVDTEQQTVTDAAPLGLFGSVGSVDWSNWSTKIQPACNVNQSRGLRGSIRLVSAGFGCRLRARWRRLHAQW